MNTTVTWRGPGWYAPAQHGSHDLQHIEWHYLCPLDDWRPGDLASTCGVGSPYPFRTREELQKMED